MPEDLNQITQQICPWATGLNDVLHPLLHWMSEKGHTVHAHTISVASWVKMLHYCKNGSIRLETWPQYIHFCSLKTGSEFSFKWNLTLSSGHKSITMDLLADSLFDSIKEKFVFLVLGIGGACLIHSLQSWNVVEALVGVKSAAELNSLLLGKLLSPLERWR